MTVCSIKASISIKPSQTILCAKAGRSASFPSCGRCRSFSSKRFWPCAILTCSSIKLPVMPPTKKQTASIPAANARNVAELSACCWRWMWIPPTAATERLKLKTRWRDLSKGASPRKPPGCASWEFMLMQKGLIDVPENRRSCSVSNRKS